MRRVVLVVVAFGATVGLITSAHAETIPIVMPVLRIAMTRVAANGPFPPGNGITWPTVIFEAKPAYTPDAMRAKIEGSVHVKMVIRPDGTVGDVTLVKSLDAQHGLDEAAIEAAKKWRFKPGFKDGKPVATVVNLMLEFRLHK